MSPGGKRVLLVVMLMVGASAAAEQLPTFRGPELDYVVHCQGCHLQDGRGTPGKVPALAGSVGYLLGLPGGRSYLTRVPGVANAPLDDAQLAALLNWMIEAFGGLQTPPYWHRFTRAEVAHGRQSPLFEVEETRSALLSGAPAPISTVNVSDR